jgi:hypothetical protein
MVIVASKVNRTYTWKHVCDGARHLYAEQARNAEQKSKDTCHETTPDEDIHIRLRTGYQFQELGRFSEKENKWGKEDGRACICPICELDRWVVAIRQRGLDQDRMNSNAERGKYTIE